MKNILAVIAAMFVLTLSISAQSGATDTANNQTPTAAELRTVQGCLSRIAGQYVITGGNGPKQYRIIEGDVSSLKNALGYSIRATGVLGKNDPVENILTPYNEGTTTGAGWDTMKLTKVQLISKNCSYTGFER